jgi:hypothetical protein
MKIFGLMMQIEILRQIKHSFVRHLGSQIHIFIAMLIILGIIIVLGAIYYIKIRPGVLRRKTRWEIFNRLCQANRLNREEINFLRRLVKGYRIENPALLFVSPSLYTGAVSAIPSDPVVVETLAKKLYELY